MLFYCKIFLNPPVGNYRKIFYVNFFESFHESSHSSSGEELFFFIMSLLSYTISTMSHDNLDRIRLKELIFEALHSMQCPFLIDEEFRKVQPKLE